MGSCVSKRNVVHPLVLDAQADLLAVGEQRGSNGDAPSVGSPTVDPNIPVSFYPATVGLGSEEEQCRLTRSKIIAKKSEKIFRHRLTELLDGWRRDSILEQIESHALSIPAENTASVKMLAFNLANSDAKYVKSLGDCGQLSLALAKAYAIFFWICNNVSFSKSMWMSYMTNSNDLRSAMDAKYVLEERECISKGHANLFHAVATAIDLRSCVVTGNIKISHSESQEPNKQFERHKLNRHWWNMVCVEGVWIAVDCACGSGMIAPHLSYQQKFVPEYFAVGPEHMIFSHLPVKSEFQLLQDTVSLSNISPMISPSIPSLSLGIEPVCWAETVTIDKDSPTTTIKVPISVPSDVRLSVNLRRASDLGLEQSLNDHNPQSSDSQPQATFLKANNDGTVCIYAAVPGHGLFFLDICAYKGSGIIFCFAYQIFCFTKPAPFTAFPNIYDTPSVAFSFQPLYWNTPQAANNSENREGKMDLVFYCGSGTQFHHYLLSGKKGSGLVCLDEVHYCTAITRDVIDHSLYRLSVVFPATGWWTIYLCAVKKAGDEVSGYTALLHFPVFVRKELQRASYPHVLSPDVYFKLDRPLSSGGSDVLVVPFFSAIDLKMCSILCDGELNGEQYQQYTLIQMLEGLNEVGGEYRYELHAVFPKLGKWYIQVFSNAAQESSAENYKPLFDLCTDVVGCMKNVVFPITKQNVIQKCRIELLHPDRLIKLDDSSKQGSLLRFKAPRKVKFDHYMEQTSFATGTDANEAFFQRHYTYLTVDDQSSTECTYGLRALFPKPGHWNIVLCARETSLSDPELALRVPVNESNPNPIVKVFPIVYSALSEFGISFSEHSVPYPRHCNFPEFNFEFTSLNCVSYAWTLQEAQSSRQMPYSSNVFLETSHNEEGGKVLRKLRFLFPKPGIWLIQVVARNVVTGMVSDNTLSLSLHYQPVFNLIVEGSTAALSHMGFPKIHEPFHTQFGLHIKGGDLPLPSRISQLPTMFTIRFYSPPGVLFWHQCTESSHFQDRKITRMISNTVTGLHELCTDISKRGQWTVYLHAKREGDTSKSWTAVLQHIVIAKTSKSPSSSSLLTMST